MHSPVDSLLQACQVRSTSPCPVRDTALEAHDEEHKEDVDSQRDSVSTVPEVGEEGHGCQFFELSDGSLSEPADDISLPEAAEQGPANILAAGGREIPEHFAKVRAPPPAASLESCIAILAAGMRGEVQPCVALARELQARGHCVTIFTSPDFVGFSNRAGVKAVPVFANLKSVCAETGGFAGQTIGRVEQLMWKAALDREVHRSAKTWVGANPSLVQDPYEALVAFEPSLVFCTFSTHHTAFAYEHEFGVPALSVYFTTAAGAFNSPKTLPRPSLFAVSPELDWQAPWSCGMDLATGPWLLLEEQEGVADAAASCGLQRFLDSGEPPVTVSWHSAMVRGHRPVSMLGQALQALALAGKRGVVLGEWGKLHELAQSLGPEQAELAAYAAEKVFFAPHFPHSWLLPRSCCLVHSGGAGSTQAALRAGCPQVVTPTGFDQFHFSQRVMELQAGVGFTSPLPEIKPATLARAITEAESMRPSLDLVARLRSERGVQSAADHVEKFLHGEVWTGKFERKWLAGKKLHSKQCSVRH